MNNDKTCDAALRTSIGAFFLLRRKGTGLPKSLNTQHAKVKMLAVQFFDEEKKRKSSLNPVQKRYQPVENAHTARVVVH